MIRNRNLLSHLLIRLLSQWASFCLVLFWTTSPLFAAETVLKNRPKLIVTIVIDQFRADYLTRFQSRFLPAKKGPQVGGFQYLMTQGAYFPFGQYDLLQCMTGPGHASILTGAYPYVGGIPLNSWFDQNKKKTTYCVEDSESPLVGPEKSASSSGVSPRNLVATTVGDELKNAGYPSQVVSVSLKDRSSVLMGGHRADLAIWMDPTSHQWVSSRYYLPKQELPSWVKKLNQETLPPLGKEYVWKISGQGTGFSTADSIPPSGQSFPHVSQFGSKADLANPLGLELTEIAAENAVNALRLGQGETTDLLAVSFSSHDYVGHAFGPNSREMEEMTVAEDRVLSRLFNFLEQKVPGGLQNVVIAFTADHGVAPSPEWGKMNKLEAGRIDENQLAKSLSEHLKEKFGNPKNGAWVLQVIDLNFYLNHEAIRDKGLENSVVEAAAKSYLEKSPYTAFVLTYSEYLDRKLPPGMFEKQTLHTYYKGRSGDVILLAKPYFIPVGSTADHFTSYSYDRTVPIILAGRSIQPGIYATRAEVVDIAPTLSFLSGVIPPSLSEGRVLHEILRK
jgi:predicted AlkP superfamily pyrophosphatase or phosphodiesterase